MSKLRLVGEQLRDEGIERVTSHNEEWIAWVRQLARKICALHGSVTTDDLRAWAAIEHRHPDHPNAWGGVFRAKGWVRVGYTKSERALAHARPIGVWVWKGDNQ